MRIKYIQAKTYACLLSSVFLVLLFLWNETSILQNINDNLEQYFIPGQVFNEI